jgi:tetratricopeptide (TPR) repeat protein
MTQSTQPAAELDALGEQFLDALKWVRDGNIDGAEDALRAILNVEPRLPEPRLELARLLLDTDRLEEAEAQAREARGYLEADGQWTDDLPANVVLALCYGLIAEILRRRADEDNVIFGDPDAFRAIVDESQTLFSKAAELDPSDEYASYHAFFLGVKGHSA